MDNKSVLISGIDYKIKKLINLHQKTKDENEKLKQQNIDLYKQIEQQNNIIKELEEKNKVLKIKGTIEGKSSSLEAKAKINEMLREIDKCIAFLNK